MPSGPLEGVPLLVAAILSTEPRRILDLGMGTGKWGFLLREQHDYAHGRRELIVDGVEGHEPYIGAHQRAVYDSIVVADVRDFLRGADTASYDVALVLDLIEHFSPAVGRDLIAEALRVAELVAITTPKRFYPQTEHPNELEHHRSWWPESELQRLAPVLGASATVAQLRMTNIALLSRDGNPPPLRRGLLGDVVARVKDRVIPERLYYRALGKTGPTL
jgi:hypothetical protein